MKNTQSPINQDQMGTEIQPQQVNNSKLLTFVVVGVVLTSIIMGSAVYFWQESANKKTINVLEQQISSLEKEISTMEKAEVVPQPVDSGSSSSPSLEPLQNNPQTSKTPTLSSIKGAKLSAIKYTLPDGWEAKIRSDQNDLFLSSKEAGGFLAIKVYPYDGRIGRRKYYCQLTQFCIDATRFTQVQVGNISGYKANALDNSGGGPEYFGVKGDQFYIISSFSPSDSSDNAFDMTYQQVLNSLVF